MENTNIPDKSNGQNLFENKLCTITIFQNEQKLIFTGLILEYSTERISFRDKYGVLYSFRSQDVIRITERSAQ